MEEEHTPGQGVQKICVVVVEHVEDKNIPTPPTRLLMTVVLPCTVGSLRDDLLRLVADAEEKRAAYYERLPRTPVELHFWMQNLKAFDPIQRSEVTRYPHSLSRIAYCVQLFQVIDERRVIRYRYSDNALRETVRNFVQIDDKSDTVSAGGLRVLIRLARKNGLEGDSFSAFPHNIRLIILRELSHRAGVCLCVDLCIMRQSFVRLCIASRVMRESSLRFSLCFQDGGDLVVSVEWAQND